MAFFKNREVDGKYRNLIPDADPMIRVAIQYHGKLSEMPMDIADKVFADGAHIALNTPIDKSTERPDKK